jgi:hypothetical protein
MNVQKLASMGAAGAAAGIIALFAFIVWLSAPVARGGIDQTSAVVTWLSVGEVVVLLVAVHVVYALVLRRASERR